MKLNVLLLAGGETPNDIQADDGARKLCLVKLGGVTLLERALNAIRCALPDARVLVNLGKDRDGAESVDSQVFANVTFFSGAPDVLGALEQALELLETDSDQNDFESPLLLITVDIPLMTGDQLKEFLQVALESGADGVWPIVERSIIEEAFPGSQRTYVRTQQGTFTGGNAFLVSPRLLKDNRDLLRKAYTNRKNPMALAGLFGMGLSMKLASGRISIPELEDWFSRKFNASLRLLPFNHAEIAVDIDKYSDYVLARKIIG